MDLFLPDYTGFLLPRPAYNASKPMIISHDRFGIVVCLQVCVYVAVAESVHSVSVAVVSGIYHSDPWWLKSYLEDLHPPHVELTQPVQFYSTQAWLLCFGWYQHWWAKRTILSRLEYQFWQELKWNQALGIHLVGSPFQVLVPLTGT